MWSSKHIGLQQHESRASESRNHFSEHHKASLHGRGDIHQHHMLVGSGSGSERCETCHKAVKQAEKTAQNRLRAKRLHHASVTLVGEAEAKASGSDYLYLVTDDDITDIVKMMMDTLRENMASEGISVMARKLDRSVDTGSPTLPGFDRERKSITPRLSAAAAPATTFSAPKTFFTRTNWGSRQLSADRLKDDLATKTTIWSRGSVSEIFWPEYLPSSNRISRHRSLARAFDRSPSHKRIQRQSTFKPSLRQDSLTYEQPATHRLSSPSELPSSNLSIQKRPSRSTDEASNIVSFPELRPRHCTNDWLNPPVEIEQYIRAPTSDLYHRGVDAHSGKPAAPPEDVWEPTQPIAVPCDHSIFAKDPFCCSSLYMHERNATNGSSSTGKPRLGSSIGSSSHRRRNSQAPFPFSYDPPWEDVDGRVSQTIPYKLRRNTPYDFSRQVYPPLAPPAWSVKPRKSTSSEAKAILNTHSRDSMTKKRTSEPPRPDSVGIYEALTGSRMLVKQHDAGLEDTRPYARENDSSQSRLQ